MNNNQQINVMIADDHQIVIDGIRSLLKKNSNTTIVGEAYDGKEALRLIKEKNIDIAILDINMPLLTGVEVTKEIKRLGLKTKVLFLTMHESPEFVSQSMEIGAEGYIVKNRGKEELEAALNALYEGKDYYGAEAKSAYFNKARQQKKNAQEIRLTRREKEVLKLIAEGLTTPKISEKLFIANATVETHRRNLLEKTKTSNTMLLVRYAVENKYV